VDIAYMHPDQVYEHILSDQSDLGLISFANPGRGFTAIPWKRQTMAVACLPGHRFARLAREQCGLLPQDLARESFVTFDRGLPVRREIDRFLRKHDVDMTVVAEFDNIENIKQAIEDGAGVALLPEPTLRREVQRGTLVKVGLGSDAGESPFARPLSIIHRRRRRLNSALTGFIKLLCRPRAAFAGAKAG
jgi:DNA-binding transcriptional LysR family regulator